MQERFLQCDPGAELTCAVGFEIPSLFLAISGPQTTRFYLSSSRQWVPHDQTCQPPWRECSRYEHPGSRKSTVVLVATGVTRHEGTRQLRVDLTKGCPSLGSASGHRPSRLVEQIRQIPDVLLACMQVHEVESTGLPFRFTGPRLTVFIPAQRRDCPFDSPGRDSGRTS